MTKNLISSSAILVALSPSESAGLVAVLKRHADRPGTALRYDDMAGDLDLLIRRHVKPYVDPSNPFLHEDEMVAECYLKIAKAVNNGLMERLKTRGEFFGFAKRTVINCIRSLIQRHVYTAKRTGNVFTKDKDGKITDYQKPERVYVDNPDSHVQLSVDADAGDVEDTQLVDDIKQYLTPIENLVFSQLVSPNVESYIYATVDADDGKRPSKIVVSKQNMAEGLGMNIRFFDTVLTSVKLKVKKFMEQERTGPTDQEAAIKAAEQRLCAALDIQLPPTIPRVVRRRMFTIAARDNVDKLDQGLYDDITTVGAVAPKRVSGRMDCFGVLWHRKDHACKMCALRESCQTECENVGLGDMTISPRLLGSNVQRTPIVLANAESPTTVVMSATTDVLTQSDRDVEVLAYLSEKFKRVSYHGHLAFKPLDYPRGSAPPIIAGEHGKPMRLRFAKPSDDIARELEKEGRAYYLPEDANSADAIALIDAHVTNAVAE